MHRFCLGLSLALTTFALACDPFEWSFDEVSRVASPSGKVDAVLVERNGGATTTFHYYAYIVPKGKSVSKKSVAVAAFDAASRSSRASGADLKWEDGRTLVVQYLTAQFATNRSPTVRVDGEHVSVVLRSDINNAAAPPGGMLYNLKKAR